MAARESGFTLIEVLLAMFLMGICLMAAAPLFVHAIRENASGADLGSVGAIAVDRLEVLRAADFFALVAGGSLTSDLAGYFDASDPRYTVRWQVADNASPATLKAVSVRVIAVRRAIGLQKEVTLACLRAR